MKKRNVTKNTVRFYAKLEEMNKYEDTRFYGLFRRKGGVYIDPIRFQKKVRKFDENQLEIINS